MRLNLNDPVSDPTRTPAARVLSELPLPAYRRFPEPPWLLPLIDVGVAFLAFVLAYFIRYDLTVFRPVLEVNQADFLPYLPYAGVYISYLFLNYNGTGLYKLVRGRSFIEEMAIISNGVTGATVILLALYFAFQPLVFSRLMLIYVAVLTILLLGLVRVGRRATHAYLRSKGVGVERVLIVGAGETGQAVLRVLMARKDLGYRPIGFLDDDPDRGNVDLGRVRGLGGLDQLRSTIQEHAVDLVIIALPWTYHDRIQTLVRLAGKAGVDVRLVPDVFQLNMRHVQVENLDGIPLLSVDSQPKFQGANRVIKRVIDISLIILALPFLFVIFLLTAIAIRLEGAGPIFHKQLRVGENGKLFHMIKFRSMIPNAEKLHQQLIQEAGEDPRHPKIKNDPRITRVGRFIRATSIDELPQLLNVLKGQMSLVGPRPPTPDEVLLYKNWHRQRLQGIPGITGLWQVSGRSDVPFDEMCLLDIYYIENWSVLFDLQILFMTFPRVLLRHGAY